jgi:hypothetical protein
MKQNIFLIIFTLVNLCILISLVAGAKQNNQDAPNIRARSIELVDDKGQSRALLSVETNGETVFRLRDAEGTIRVKLGAENTKSKLAI